MVATLRDFIRQLQKLPQDAQVLIYDIDSQCLLPPIVHTLDSATIEIAAPSRMGDRSARDAIELGHLEMRMDVEGDPFQEP
jgi:hypothetical protein